MPPETANELPELRPIDALLVVDVQNDFCPGGALAVPQGDAIIPVLNEWIDHARKSDAFIYASRDWHPPGHVSFTEKGGPWPEHCVRGTVGAELHPDLNLPPAAEVLPKGTEKGKDNYSAFDGTGLTDLLRESNVQRVWIGGLALDVCVRATALDAVSAGFDVHLIRDATRAVDPDNAADVFGELRENGVMIEEAR